MFPSTLSGYRSRSVLAQTPTFCLAEAAHPWIRGGRALRRGHRPRLQVRGGGLRGRLHRMLQRLWQRQRPRLPQHAGPKVQNPSGRLQKDMNNEAVKNGAPLPPPLGTCGGLALATTTSTNANKNKHDGGRRALFASLMATSWFKENYFLH